MFGMSRSDDYTIYHQIQELGLAPELLTEWRQEAEVVRSADLYRDLDMLRSGEASPDLKKRIRLTATYDLRHASQRDLAQVEMLIEIVELLHSGFPDIDVVVTIDQLAGSASNPHFSPGPVFVAWAKGNSVLADRIELLARKMANEFVGSSEHVARIATSIERLDYEVERTQSRHPSAQVGGTRGRYFVD